METVNETIDTTAADQKADLITGDDGLIEVQQNNTGVATAKNDKPRAKRRVAALIVGQWMSTGVFCPANHQPTGKDCQEIKELAAWLKQPKNIEALMKEGLTEVAVVRKELISASFIETKILKARVS
jgi:hypothetical protein